MTRGIAPALDDARLSTLLGELAVEAFRHRFDVAPNPCVGAAVLSGERVIARGFHEAWGEAHAEVRALDAAVASGVDPAGLDTLVVTLEPCSTRGKTPPCVERVLASGIRRVVVGAVDPDPRHRGQGLERLREAGVELVLLEQTAPLSGVSPHFLAWNDPDRLRRPRPWTIAKWAQTRSGQLTPPPNVGGGRWISGPQSQDEALVLRGRVDAILTGEGTVLRDDPRLTVRPPGDTRNAPIRVVLDSRLNTPTTARILARPGSGESGGEVHILCVGGSDEARHRALVEAGAIVHELHVATDDGVSLRDAHTWMWERGVRRVLLEAGPRLLSHHLQSGFVDQIRVYTGSVNGGEGITMAEWMTRLKFKQRLDRESGPDAVLEAFL